jgi:hypothetical protein
MVCYRVYGDAEGETHVTALDLPVRETPVGSVRGLGEVPTTTVGMAQFVDCRKPDSGMHEPPRRAFIVVLGGELEIITSLEDRAVLRPGDFLLADDMGTKGHISRDVGEVPLTMMTIGIADGWDGPEI